jgi:hypothetical protein
MSAKLEERARELRYSEKGLHHTPPYYEHINDREFVVKLSALLTQVQEESIQHTVDVALDLQKNILAMADWLVSDEAKYKSPEYRRQKFLGLTPQECDAALTKVQAEARLEPTTMVRRLYEFFQGPQACGDFTCTCGNCGLCDFRKEVETWLAALDQAAHPVPKKGK